MKLIDACALTRTMYLKSFETDDGRQRWDSGLWIRYKIFEEARDEQLIVDAVPVIHGEWLDRSGESQFGTCSVCGDRWGSISVMKYCPSCGAKMDGERK